jgi:hypothetical protein
MNSSTARHLLGNQSKILRYENQVLFYGSAEILTRLSDTVRGRGTQEAQCRLLADFKLAFDDLVRQPVD